MPTSASGALLLLSLCSGLPQGSAPPAAPPTFFRLAQVGDETLAVLDRGFCAEYERMRTSSDILRDFRSPSLDALSESVPAALRFDRPRPPSRWTIRFYASHSFTTYFPTDISFNSSRYTAEIKDYQWAERGSRTFFNPSTWAKPGNNPLQVLDEPTNTFVLSIEKDGHEFFLSAFHPKFEQAPGQVKRIDGVIDGVPVNGVQPVNQPFHGYVLVPGESKLVRNENTFREMIFEVGYGYRLKLLDGRLGSVVYAPGVAAGVAAGNNYSVIVQEGQWWEFDGYRESYGVHGFGGSLINRLEINGPRESFGLFYENKLGYYRMKHGFLDGTQQYGLGFMGHSVGLKIVLRDPRRR